MKCTHQNHIQMNKQRSSTRVIPLNAFYRFLSSLKKVKAIEADLIGKFIINFMLWTAFRPHMCFSRTASPNPHKTRRLFVHNMLILCPAGSGLKNADWQIGNNESCNSFQFVRSRYQCLIICIHNYLQDRSFSPCYARINVRLCVYLFTTMFEQGQGSTGSP